MNLLTDALFRVETPRGQMRLSLPALLEALGGDEIESLVGIQRHQEDAFHVFLCYLAGTIMARDGKEDPVQEEDYWRRGLRKLAGRDDDFAWTLVVEDPMQPAFMQPPLPGGDAKKLKVRARTPDQLDLLPTSKNHDVKAARAGQPDIDEWTYALVSLQTMSGYFGKGNQGISRMKSGFGNRPIVEMVHSFSPGPRWRFACVRLLKEREIILRGPWGYSSSGKVLLWLDIWDGTSSFPLKNLDPFYIEVCRRIRLCSRSNIESLWAEAVPAEVMRVSAKELLGNVGDPWLPIDLSKSGAKVKGQSSALTVGPSGISPDLLRRLVFEDQFTLSSLQKPLKDVSGTVWLYVSVLVRGQGTTDGFHEKRIRIPGEIRNRLFNSPQKDLDRLAALSKTAIEYAGVMQNRVLKPAVFSYLEGAPERLEFTKDSAVAWWTRAVRRFEALWSDDYFPWLWASGEIADLDQARYDWAFKLSAHALLVLREVMEAMPGRTGRRFRARTGAERLFWGALYNDKHFPFLKEDRHATGTSR